MRLKEIYRPIEKELVAVEHTLRNCLRNTRHKPILETSNYLLYAGGKRLRPALVLLSAKATLSSQPPVLCSQLIKIASAVELIHLASLIHDDVIDHSCLRHNKPSINYKWGEDVAIALGDYLYSVAFELISTCGNMEILQCISSATKMMCEGELLQVCERDNLDLLKERYLLIVRKKTASLFAASAEVGASISNTQQSLQNALKEYGLNFGIAFQIIDDYLDLIGEEKELGKRPGQDIEAGEATLPILNLWESISEEERKESEKLLFSVKGRKLALRKIRKKLFESGAAVKTKGTAEFFVNLAKAKIGLLVSSDYKESLFKLTDFILERGFS